MDAKNVALVGIRDVDIMERRIVRKSGVRAFTMRDIDERGLRAVMQEAIEIASAGTAGFHFHSTWMRWTRNTRRASVRR